MTVTSFTIETPGDSVSNGPAVVLASASESRRRLLRGAGVPFRAEASAIDEEEIKAALRAEGASAMQVAETLAELKARRIVRRHPGALIVGADQMLDCDGRWFDKPGFRAAAAEQLRALSGRAHELLTSVCLLRDEQRIWHHNARARLVMRPLSDAFIDAYLDAVGEAALHSVGAYQIEGRGAQLFAQIEGDGFAIQGLPLLPLLEMLRQHGVLAR